jgi:hypothetical protein
LQLRAVVRGVLLHGGSSAAPSLHAQPLSEQIRVEDFATAAQAACRRIIHAEDDDAAAQLMGHALKTYHQRQMKFE